jgi:anthranilate synthase/indole-3-glycerol phosphate synthase/phosphoribosylanthranilate isomerase
MAIATAEAGADFIGLVFAANSRRKVTQEQAQEIVTAINAWKLKNNKNKFDVDSLRSVKNHENHFSHYAQEITRLVRQSKPVIVGVFSDNSQEEVNELATKVPLDLIQLSGNSCCYY